MMLAIATPLSKGEILTHNEQYSLQFSDDVQGHHYIATQGMVRLLVTCLRGLGQVC